MLRIFFIFLSAIAFVSCRDRFDVNAAAILEKIPLEQKVGQMLMLSVPGKAMNDKALTIISNYYPGGIILFQHNTAAEEVTADFINDLQNAACGLHGIPLFISTDQEGGRVRRIADGVTQFPGAMSFGIVNDKSVTYDYARIIGIELRKIGVNMNLAPDLDVNNNPENPVINTRSFGSDPQIVSAMGKSYIKGLRKSMCIAVAKHFPGHGDTNKDSHKILPVINHDMERLRETELVPFTAAIRSGVDAIMTAHISYPDIIKDDLPATLSGRFLNDLLRDEMRFQGIVITDDLEMNAVSGNMEIGEAAIKAVLAGADMILISSYNENGGKIFEALVNAVNNGVISIERINVSVKRIIELKLRYGIMKFEEGLVTLNKFIYKENEIKLLNEAKKINADVSKESIFYHSDNKGNITYGNSGQNIFISSSNIFAAHIENEIGKDTYKLYNSIDDFEKYIKGKNNHLPDNTKIYYQFDNPDKEIISGLDKLCESTGICLVLLCTGNPFLLNDLSKIPPVYITFSNTDVSMRQLALCLKGEFLPKREINVNLGFNKTNR